MSYELNEHGEQLREHITREILNHQGENDGCDSEEKAKKTAELKDRVVDIVNVHLAASIAKNLVEE